MATVLGILELRPLLDKAIMAVKEARMALVVAVALLRLAVMELLKLGALGVPVLPIQFQVLTSTMPVAAGVARTNPLP